jgi:NAD(P)-dependent dehydrogenase (short-subunit alcohol dehydrogenase family)
VVAGSTATPGSDSLAAQTNPDSSIEEFRAARVTTIPLGRFAEPVEIANAAVFLASGLSSFTTGSTIDADGGYNRCDRLPAHHLTSVN